MTEPRKPAPDTGQDADREPVLDAEILHDLDAPAEDADEIRGGKCWAVAATTLPSGTMN